MNNNNNNTTTTTTTTKKLRRAFKQKKNVGRINIRHYKAEDGCPQIQLYYENNNIDERRIKFLEEETEEQNKYLRQLFNYTNAWLINQEK